MVGTSTSAVSLSSATLADKTPGCACRTCSTAEEQEEQCMPLTDTCTHSGHFNHGPISRDRLRADVGPGLTRFVRTSSKVDLHSADVPKRTTALVLCLVASDGLP